MLEKILVYGHDSILLMTHRKILEKEHFQVFAALELEDAIHEIANREIDLLILCQSLRPFERGGILDTVRANRPAMKILIMEPDEDISLHKPQEQAVDVLPELGDFLSVIHRMLSTSGGVGWFTNLNRVAVGDSVTSSKSIE